MSQSDNHATNQTSDLVSVNPDATGHLTKNDITANPEILIAGARKHLKQAIERVLHAEDHRARARMLTYLTETAQGIVFLRIVTQGIDWAEIRTYRSKYPEFAALCRLAVEMGEESRQHLREAAIDHRGIDGWDEPVFHKGEICGHIRRFDNRLLELAVKAGNPDKYADRQHHKHEGRVDVVRYEIGIQTQEPRSIDSEVVDE